MPPAPGYRTTGQPAPSRLDATRPGPWSLALGVSSAELCTGIYSSSGSRHKCEHTNRIALNYIGFLCIYIPCAMALRLMPCSPRRRIPFCHRRCRLEAETIRLDRISHRLLDISNGCQDHTVLPYAISALRPARIRSLTGDRPVNALARRRCRVHRIPSRVRDDGQRPSCRERTGRAGRTDLPDGESEIFFAKGLDRFLSQRLICPSGAGIGWAKALLRRAHHLSTSWFERWARFALPTLRDHAVIRSSRRLPLTELSRRSRPYHASMHGRLRWLRGSGFGTDRRPDMIQRRVSAGSMTSSISSTEAIETALPLA